ncbi:hypothetical protein JCGZ_06572 [Jatropha curcas]|uniref:CCHC-type domain-containing protein n=1 Tax=Jatropha curcas TaxID=180498 RepID=A0A067LQF4_JATCU|nr:hypothetical protein JCGZ_06572 [Jatropha curcas]
MDEISKLPLPEAFLDFLHENGLDPSIYTVSDKIPRYIRLKPGSEDDREPIGAEINCKLERVGWLPGFYSLPPQIRIANSRAYREGKMYGIDAASGAAVLALNVSGGDHILDLCAAPGSNSVMSNVISVMTKITEDMLNGANFLDWSKTIRVYLRSINRDDHLTCDPPKDDTNQAWLREDARLLLQIRNSIDSELIGLINHCDFVKELMDYLEFLYSAKGNNFHTYGIWKAFSRLEKGDKTLIAYFMEFEQVYEELNVLLPFSTNVKVQQSQREQMAVMSFLAGLSPKFDAARTQVLSSSELPSLHETFTKILRTETPQLVQPIPNSALVSWNEVGCQNSRSGDLAYKKGRSGNRDENYVSRDSGDVICYYCHKPGHNKYSCRKLQHKNQCTQVANIASCNGRVTSSEKNILISADEFAQFSQNKASLKSTTPIGVVADLVKSTTCLVSTSSK